MFKQKLNLYAIYRNNISQENRQNTLASILIRYRIAGREVIHAFKKKKVILNTARGARKKIDQKGSCTFFKE